MKNKMLLIYYIPHIICFIVTAIFISYPTNVSYIIGSIGICLASILMLINERIREQKKPINKKVIYLKDRRR